MHTAEDAATPSPRPRSARSSRWTNKKSAGYILVGKATWNYKVYEQDLSGGMHNPDYVVDGLMKAEDLAQSVGGKFKAVSGGKGVVSGIIVGGDNKPAIGFKLILMKNGKATSQWADVRLQGRLRLPGLRQGQVQREVDPRLREGHAHRQPDGGREVTPAPRQARAGAAGRAAGKAAAGHPAAAFPVLRARSR